MIKKSLQLFFLLLMGFTMSAQTTVVFADWDDVDLDISGKFEVGAVTDSLIAITANPNPSGVNTSDSVQLLAKGPGAQTWGGYYYDLTGELLNLNQENGTVCVDVLADHEINFRLKIEMSNNEGPDASFELPYNTPGEWQTLCFDVFGEDTGGGIEVLKGFTYTRITLFPEFGTVPEEEEHYYVDNVKQIIDVVYTPDPVVIADWDNVDLTINGSFGNGVFGDSTFAVVMNPNPSGVNTSDSVQLWEKAADAQSWAGFFYDLTEPLDLTGAYGTVCVDVLADYEINFRFKVEQDTGGIGVEASFDLPYTTPGEWQTLCFDVLGDDVGGGNGTLKGYLFNRITLFPEFGTTPAENASYYVDNITGVTGGIEIKGAIISDYETEETTSPMLGSFGNGSYGDSLFTVVPNPLVDASNSSAMVQEWCKASDAETWGGFFIDVDTIDFTGTLATVCISILSDHEANVRLKLEQSETGPDLSIDQTYSSPGEWQELCYDFTLPDVGGNVGLGHIYKRITMFPDFGTTPAANTCYYIDNVYDITNGGGEILQLIGNVINASPDHTILTGLLNTSDLWGEVNASGVTVFAPTDAAFNALPAATLEALMNNTDNALFNALLHHVTNDSLPSDLLTMGLQFVTRNGQDATVTAAGSQVDNANITDADVLGVNGILHIVDAVLEFPDDPDKIIIGDYEDPVTSPEWKYFSAPGPPTFISVANPAADDVNGSATVAEYKKYPVGDPWQGIYYDLARPLNLYGENTSVCMDFWSDHEGPVRLKLEKSITGSPDASFVVENMVPNAWNKICWDLSQESVTEDVGIIANNIYTRTTLFFDFENSQPLPEDTVTYYFDNVIQVIPGSSSTYGTEKLENFEFYPNPADNWISITSDTPIHAAFIYDITGKVLMRTINPTAERIDISGLTTGMYFANIRDKNGQDLGTVKFIKR